VALECQLFQRVPLSTNQLIAIGRIVCAHVADRIVLNADAYPFDTPRLNLIGGMHAAKWHARTNNLLAMERPTWADWSKQKA
jgi:flavin reductase (DIM6/NTAB) family NADH-FMN oxidoreductase RutF